MTTAAASGTVALSLGAAASWGAGDFTGGVASRSADPVRVVAGAHICGLVLAAALASIMREPLPSPNAAVWGALGGVSGGLALVALYRALTIGPMGVNAPVSAVITAALPVFIGLRMQAGVSAPQIAGLALAALSIVLVSRPERLKGRPRGLGLAVLAGAGFGIFLVALRQAGIEHVLWPLAIARAASMLTMLAIIAVASVRRRRSSSAAEGPRSAAYPWRIVVLAGALDTIGNGLFMFATQRGSLAVAGALSSLYPVTTVLLARAINHERMHRVQALGSFLAIIAVPLIAS